jgi:DNA-binding NarL/FixJ family response regulator
VICEESADQLEAAAPTLIWQERCSKNASMALPAFANRKPTDGVPDGSPNSQIRPEFARQSQLAADGHRIPIVLVTGSGHHHREKVMQAGALAVLHKRVNEQHLLMAIRAASKMGRDCN